MEPKRGGRNEDFSYHPDAEWWKVCGRACNDIKKANVQAGPENAPVQDLLKATGNNTRILIMKGGLKMSYVKLLMTLLALFILFYLIYPQKVHAYIDPGSGSIIIQVLIAAFFGALFAVKMFWKRIKIFFNNLFSTDSKNEKTKG